jgi:hypothetical protein
MLSMSPLSTFSFFPSPSHHKTQCHQKIQHHLKKTPPNNNRGNCEDQSILLRYAKLVRTILSDLLAAVSCCQDPVCTRERQLPVCQQINHLYIWDWRRRRYPCSYLHWQRRRQRRKKDNSMNCSW